MGGKNNKLNKVKKIKGLIFLLLVILILLVVGIIIIKNDPIEKNLRYIYNNKTSDNVTMPLNINKGFSGYKGYVNRLSVYKSLDLFVKKQLPNYYKDVQKLDESGLKNYYNKNADKIKVELGLIKEEEFIELANTIKVLKEGNFELNQYVINPLSVKTLGNGISFALIIEYKDNEKIAVEVIIKNSIDETKTPTKIKGGVDSKYLDYTYSSGVEDYKNVDEVVTGGTPGKVIK